MPYVLDNFFLEGWIAVYRIAISVLKELESDMMDMDMESLSRYL